MVSINAARQAIRVLLLSKAKRFYTPAAAINAALRINGVVVRKSQVTENEDYFVTDIATAQRMVKELGYTVIQSAIYTVRH